MSEVLPQPEITQRRPDWLAGAGGFEPRHRCGHAGQRKGVAHMLTATTEKHSWSKHAKNHPHDCANIGDADSDLFRPGLPTRSRPGFRDEAGRLAAVGGVKGLMPTRRELTMRQLR